MLVKHGRWEVQVQPAVYEEQDRKVLVSPEHKIVRTTSPVYETEKVAHKVTNGYGHQHYVTKATQKLVEPARETVETKPAVYKTVKVKVQVEPARYNKVYHQPVYETRTEKYLVKPAYVHKIFHKPVIGYEQHKVIVKYGQTFARPVYKKHGEAC